LGALRVVARCNLSGALLEFTRGLWTCDAGLKLRVSAPSLVPEQQAEHISRFYEGS